MLRINNVYKTFNKKTEREMVLYEDLNLNVEPHEFVTVIGSNGSGKSTLLNVICGSVNIDGGSLKFKGNDITKLKPFQRYKTFARVYQDPSAGTSPSLTVFENLSLALNKGKLMSLKWGKEHKARDFFIERLKELNLDLENKLGTRVSDLSGGQRQALSLVMSLLNDPELLLLDEHTAALDPKNSEIIMKLTDKMVADKKITTIMITHNLNHALEYGNRLIMFHEGKIIADYSKEEKEKLTRDDLVNLFKTYQKYFVDEI